MRYLDIKDRNGQDVIRASAMDVLEMCEMMDEMIYGQVHATTTGIREWISEVIDIPEDDLPAAEARVLETGLVALDARLGELQMTLIERLPDTIAQCTQYSTEIQRLETWATSQHETSIVAPDEWSLATSSAFDPWMHRHHLRIIRNEVYVRGCSLEAAMIYHNQQASTKLTKPTHLRVVKPNQEIPK